jgi:hypothetical protein
MKRLVLFTAAIALLAAIVTTPALAKGASKAKITGPDLGSGITLAGEGQVGGAQLMQLAQTAGFFPAVFVSDPNPMLSTRPHGALGPRYTITYTMPGPSGVDELRQDLYPYAEPSPVAYTKPGQPFFGTEETVGGWYVASTSLKDELVAAGLPESSPVDGRGFAVRWTAVSAVAAVLAVLVVVGVATLRSRRRPGQATA